MNYKLILSKIIVKIKQLLCVLKYIFFCSDYIRNIALKH